MKIFVTLVSKIKRGNVGSQDPLFKISHRLSNLWLLNHTMLCKCNKSKSVLNKPSKQLNLLYINSTYMCYSIPSVECLTFLNCTRLHAISPKKVTVAGCCVLIMIVGSIRFILIGNKYHCIWSISTSIVSIDSPMR